MASKNKEFFSLYKTAQILGLKQAQVKEMQKKGEIPFIETPFGTRYNVAAVKLQAARNAMESAETYVPPVNLRQYRPGRMAYAL